MTTPPVYLKGLSDREACQDTVLRFVQGLDEKDQKLLESVWLDEAIFDPTGLNATGGQYSQILGKDQIIPHLLSRVGEMDTLHMLSNFRIDLRGDAASLTCSSLAQHHHLGEGSQAQFGGLLMGNRLTIDLQRAGDIWKMSKLYIKNAWAQGRLAGHT